MKQIYDMIIIGGGPGGYTAALYGARAGLDVLVLEKLSVGGQMALSMQIDNYPGFEEGIDGYTLGVKMQAGAERFGTQTEYAEVTALHLNGDIKEVETSEGVFYGKTLVVAMGASHKNLGIPDENKLVGRGLNYCASCDGMFYKDKTVVVVGGGNSAAADALLLSRIAKKVILVHRRDSLRASKIYHKALEDAENVEFVWNSVVDAFLNEDKIYGVQLRNLQTGLVQNLDCDGVFVSIGRKPSSDLVKEQLLLDKDGYIVADESTCTNIPGVFAVGDIRTKALRQIVTAVADGATAVHYAQEYLGLQ